MSDTNAVAQLPLLTAQLGAMLRYRSELEAIMADVDTAVADLAAAVAGVAGRVAEDVAELKRQLDAATGLSESQRAQLQATADAIEANVAKLGEIDPIPDVAPPVEPPVEEPPVDEPPTV